MLNSTESASREILWNVSSLPNVIAMYFFFGLSVLVLAACFWRRIELWSNGQPEPGLSGNYLKKLKNFLFGALFQKKVIKEKSAAIGHTLIYLGFFILLFTTTMVMLDHDFGINIYRGNFYLLVTLASDLFGLAVLVGCALLAHRRYVKTPDQLHNKTADKIFLGTIALLVVQGFVLEGLRIHATHDPWAVFSPVGLLFAKLFWFASLGAAKLIHYLTWWFHSLTVFLFIAILPYTKFFHILSSSLNLYFKKEAPKGQLKSPGNLEEMIESDQEFQLGLESIKDYTWKQLLDLDACTSCGRCQKECPAYLSNKPLSPKWLILDTRNHFLSLNGKNQSKSYLPEFLLWLDKFLLNKLLLSPSGLKKDGKHFTSNGEYRGSNKAVQNNVKELGKSAEARIMGEVLDPDLFWSCTTCMACVDVCPVGINHVEQIIENRRNSVLMQGEMPNEAQNTLRALENRGNPYGPPEQRSNWIEDLQVPVLSPGNQVEYLYWVGCVSSFDPRKQKIAQALVQIFQKADVSFGILGNAESCSGDPARRLGEENLYQFFAKQNVKLLKQVKFKTLVANCPHCFNTIKNEYSQFGKIADQKAVIKHHSQVIHDLIESKKINLKSSSDEYTFHDPCYLGRYNDEYEAPRKTLKAVKGLKILEMEKSRDKGMCCGAGGGHFWMDMKKGERINVLRTEQAAETGAKKIATACPFCMQMMEDGTKLTKYEDFEVKDIAEVICENLQ